VNLKDGTPSGLDSENQNSGNLKDEDRYEKIATAGIAPAVQVLFTTGESEDGELVVTPTDVSGINVLNEGDSTGHTKRWYWSEYPE